MYTYLGKHSVPTHLVEPPPGGPQCRYLRVQDSPWLVVDILPPFLLNSTPYPSLDPIRFFSYWSLNPNTTVVWD